MNNKPENTYDENTQVRASDISLSSNSSVNDRTDPIKPSEFVPLKGLHTRSKKTIRPIHFAIGIPMIFLAAIASFLFISKSVLITTEPLASNINVNGPLAFKVGGNYLLLSGEHEVSIQTEGYYPLTQSFNVGPEQNQEVNFELKPLPGKLTVVSNVSEAGEVWIDGEKVGSLNKEIDGIDAGQHELQIVTDRYQEYSQQIDIEGKEKSQAIDINLVPAWAEVQISTVPNGASIIVDGEEVGNTPTTAEILQGEREVVVALTGHKTHSETLLIKAGEHLDLGSIILEKADGLIRVQSKPAQASITINGEYYGLTPLDIPLASGSNYQITLFKDGYQQTQKNITIQSTDKQIVNVDLSANLGEITFQTNPEDALLYVDGRLMGRANKSLTLPTSQVQISVKKEGYADYQTTVLPKVNFDQIISINLKTIEEAKWENIKPLISTKFGHTLKLFKPNDTFEMGSSRREQGRRANESLRTVKLSRAFYLGTKEVTNAQFREFQNEHSSSNVKGQSLDGNSYPVTNISWQQAALFCNWLSEQENLPAFYLLEEGLVTGFNPQSHGYRLPTEAEWTWAARVEQGKMLKYSWGEQLPPTKNSGNFADRNAAPLVGLVQVSYDDGYAATAPVGSFQPNQKEIYDLAGNVSEWINDFYDITTGLSVKADVDPLGPSEGDFHVIRGSSWAHGNITELRLSFRDYGEDKRNDVGFRIARFVE